MGEPRAPRADRPLVAVSACASTVCGEVMLRMDAEEARTIDRRVRQVRYARDKSLRVIAGLAGMSKSQLDRIERGEVALDKLSEIVALANALQIAPSDLMSICPVPAPGKWAHGFRHSGGASGTGRGRPSAARRVGTPREGTAT